MFVYDAFFSHLPKPPLPPSSVTAGTEWKIIKNWSHILPLSLPENGASSLSQIHPFTGTHFSHRALIHIPPFTDLPALGWP